MRLAVYYGRVRAYSIVEDKWKEFFSSNKPSRSEVLDVLENSPQAAMSAPPKGLRSLAKAGHVPSFSSDRMILKNKIPIRI